VRAAPALSLAIEGLSKRYPGGVQALDDVTLTIPPGLFGLLGPNGAGKSTLMRTLATLQEADTGRARLTGGDQAGDQDIDVLASDGRDRLRRQLGYLPQEFGLYPKVTAFELLDHLAALKGIGPQRRRWDEVNALLRRTNLYDVRHRKLGTYSGGMKQRFGIAQALLGQPKLVIVDEPTAGLDPEERARFHGLLADIGQEVIVILSTHIVADVSDLCPRMAIINKGKVVLTGEPTQVASSLAGRIWRKLVSRDELGRWQTDRPAEGVTLLRQRRIAGQVAVQVHSEVTPDVGFEPVEPDLEDAYFWAIRRPQPNVPSPPAGQA
jgi:ABC-type multidrug transport system ATPase subunit